MISDRKDTWVVNLAGFVGGLVAAFLFVRAAIRGDGFDALRAGVGVVATAVILASLYRGYRWARWATFALFAASAVLLVGLPDRFAMEFGSTAVACALLYAISAAVLLPTRSRRTHHAS